VIFVWNVAAMQTIDRLRKHRNPDGEYLKDMSRCYVGGVWPVTVIGILLYLTFLWALPDLREP
jgi:hypothetical protein